MQESFDFEILDTVSMTVSDKFLMRFIPQ